MSFLKAIWRGNLKHKKLYDERTLAGAFECEPMTEGAVEEVTFRAKYLGSTLVEKASSEEATAEAIKTILSMAKAAGRKLQRVAVCLSLNGIKVVDVPTEETRLDVSIYRISYCSADAAHSQVFAFIATNANETMECHAFLCPKRKTAQVMSLTLARVFRTAYDLLADDFHQNKFILPDNKIDPSINPLPDNLITDDDDHHHHHHHHPFTQVDTNALLIDFHSELDQNRLGGWECFDEDSPDNLNYDRLWETDKKGSVGPFSSRHLNDFFGGNRWEDSRANLLCS